MPAKGKWVAPKTDPARLARVPQFAPDNSFEVHGIDSATGAYQAFAPERQIIVESVLTDCLPKTVEPGTVNAARFLRYAQTAIATFEHRKRTADQFNRPQAKAELENAVSAIIAAQRALERIASWKEISDYLKHVYLDAVPKVNVGTSDIEETMQLRQEQEEGLYNEYLSFSPAALAARLMQLEPVLSLAIEKVGFGPGGDSLRDDIAQEFCNDLAYAWILVTDRIPTFPKPNPQSRKLSPFANLLRRVNDEVLLEYARNDGAFQYFGIQAVARMRQLFPTLTKLRRRSGPKAANSLLRIDSGLAFASMHTT